MLAWMVQHSKEGKKLVLGLIRKPENPRSDSQGYWIKKIGCKCPIATLRTDRLSLLQGSLNASTYQ